MDKKYLTLLAKEYPNIESAAGEMVNLSAIRSLPKGTEYFFSDLHGEYEAFLYMIKSASGIIRRPDAWEDRIGCGARNACESDL